MKSLSVGLALLCVSCSANAPTAPTSSPQPAPVPLCQTNVTATVTFENRFSSTTVDVIWDGAKLTTITPGQKTSGYAFAAIVPHTLRFQITNTTLLACAAGTPTLSVCSNTNYFCPG